MRLVNDAEGKVNYNEINENTTVRDILSAIDLFLQQNPLPCTRCEDSCCKKNWSVGMDNVSVNRLCDRRGENLTDYVRNFLSKKENLTFGFDQYVQKKEKNCFFITEENFCSIYEDRPIICRLFICGALSDRYDILRGVIAATYLEALTIEEKIRNQPDSIEFNDRFNPAVFAKGYDLLLTDILNYALLEGWLVNQEIAELLANKN